MACTCDNARKNTGVTRCKSLFYAPKKIIFVPTYDDTGAKNKIAAAATLNSAYLTAALNDTDDQRWYPLPLMENAVINTAESAYETPKSAKKYLISEGITSLTAELFEQELKYLEKLKDKNCGDWSFFLVDIYGNQLGRTDGTDFYPINLAQGTLSAVPKFSEEKTSVPKLMLNFDFEETIKMEELIIISAAEWGTANLLTDANGLLDVNVVVSDEGSTGFTAVFTADYGTFKNKIDITGFVVGDFVSTVTAATSKIRNTTTGADVTITSVTESPDGTYTFAYSSGVSNGDVLTLAADKDGYEFPNTTVTIDHT